jgi:hypothetical protein
MWGCIFWARVFHALVVFVHYPTPLFLQATPLSTFPEKVGPTVGIFHPLHASFLDAFLTEYGTNKKSSSIVYLLQMCFPSLYFHQLPELFLVIAAKFGLSSDGEKLETDRMKALHK